MLLSLLTVHDAQASRQAQASKVETTAIRPSNYAVDLTGTLSRATGRRVSVRFTLPPVLLARHDTTTSYGLENAALTESCSVTLPKQRSAPSSSCSHCNQDAFYAAEKWESCTHTQCSERNTGPSMLDG